MKNALKRWEIVERCVEKVCHYFDAFFQYFTFSTHFSFFRLKTNTFTDQCIEKLRSETNAVKKGGKNANMVHNQPPKFGKKDNFCIKKKGNYGDYV